ncbi:MAG TPA: helix-turn-helix domain-containing protein [Terriglobales bacterium]|nr:helix-turn-helix domain-containing protein [Terriglobales bacterium]
MIDERKVAELTGISLSTVRRWRRQEQGPSFVKIGASVRYRPEDVIRWPEEQKARHGHR